MLPEQSRAIGPLTRLFLEEFTAPAGDRPAPAARPVPPLSPQTAALQAYAEACTAAALELMDFAKSVPADD
jgi:hypothetical protein